MGKKKCQQIIFLNFPRLRENSKRLLIWFIPDSWRIIWTVIDCIVGQNNHLYIPPVRPEEYEWYWVGWVQVNLRLERIENVWNILTVLIPPIIRAATMMIGIAQLMPRSWPKISLPQIAPSLAATRVTAIAVDRRWVGNTSTPRISSSIMREAT